MELLEYALRREGYDVSRAYDGETAVEAVTREKPDLVVLDLNLPKLAGFVVLERIRHQDEHVAVLLLSARQDESEPAACAATPNWRPNLSHESCSAISAAQQHARAPAHNALLPAS